MRAFRIVALIATLSLVAVSPLVGRWAPTASASPGPVTAHPEAIRAPASDNEDDNQDELCNSDNPRKQKKCHYNTSNDANDNNDNGNDNSNDRSPDLSIGVSNADPRSGDTIVVTLHASGNELDRIWWWVPDVFSDNGNGNDNDSDLANEHSASCDGNDDCTRTWDLKVRHSGAFTIHARASDDEGRESDEASTDVHVHD